jgi:hypothetical protein
MTSVQSLFPTLSEAYIQQLEQLLQDRSLMPHEVGNVCGVSGLVAEQMLATLAQAGYGVLRRLIYHHCCEPFVSSKAYDRPIPSRIFCPECDDTYERESFSFGTMLVRPRKDKL